ncbi:MAG: hypothetical protein JO272_08740 [Pseudonocardiales bacterium]|nr:hypothetical protein [Pseudonocardiales bacterium]
MGRHHETPPQPDPTRDGHKPGGLFPHRQPGKHEKPDEPEDPGKDSGKQEKK